MIESGRYSCPARAGGPDAFWLETGDLFTDFMRDCTWNLRYLLEVQRNWYSLVRGTAPTTDAVGEIRGEHTSHTSKSAIQRTSTSRQQAQASIALPQAS